MGIIAWRQTENLGSVIGAAAPTGRGVPRNASVAERAEHRQRQPKGEPLGECGGKPGGRWRSQMKDEPTQAEKRAVLRNDQRVAAYSHVVDLYDDTRPHGRFAVGARQPVTQVPRQPEHSPWSADSVRFNGPDELGFSIDQMAPVGSAAEIETSIRQLEAATRPAPSSSPARPTVAGAASPFRRRV